MTLIKLTICAIAVVIVVICAMAVGILLLMLAEYLDNNNPEWYKQLKKKLER